MAARTPRVSVIIPTFNRAGFIREAMDSVLAQTFDDFELIVVDDGSTDDTAAVVRGVADPRVRHVRHPVNQGGGAARNTGIRQACGDFVAFQDSDDTWLPHKLEKQIRLFESDAGLGVVFCACDRESQGRRRVIPPVRAWPDCADLPSALLRTSLVSTQTAVIRRECLDRDAVFDDQMPALQDWDLFIRLSRRFRFGFVSEVLVCCRDYGESLSRDVQRFVAAYERIIDKYRPIFEAQPGLLAWHWATIGNQLCRRGEIRRGRAYLLKALRRNPGRLQYGAAWLLSFLGRDVYLKALAWDRRRRGLDA